MFNFDIDTYWFEDSLFNAARGKDKPINILNEVQTSLENDDERLSSIKQSLIDVLTNETRDYREEIEEVFDDMDVKSLMTFITVEENSFSLDYDKSNGTDCMVLGTICYRGTCSFDDEKFFEHVKEVFNIRDDIER